MHTSVFTGGFAGIVAFGIAACAQQVPSELNAAALQQAETRYPEPLAALKEADRVDWRNGAVPPTDMNPNDPRSNFIRAQTLMLKLANAAYNPQAEFDRQVNKLGFVGNRITSDGGKFAAEAYVGGSEKLGMVFAALRGTSNAADKLTDFLMVPTVGAANGLPGTVHTGFALYEDALYADVRKALDVACNPNLAPGQKVPLWVTGHSLGAAAAALMAYRLKQDGCNVMGVALFGPPRPGLADFKAAYDARLPNITQRWTTENDPMYCMPPGSAWRHVGTENTLSSGINVGVSTDESQCNSPTKMIGFLKTGLTFIDPVSYGSAFLTQALLDWLKGKFDLGFECPADVQWDNTLSFAACKVTDFGYGVVSVYGNLQPTDILNGAITAIIMGANHDTSRYLDGLKADFNDPAPEIATVRAYLPGTGIDGTVLREEVFQGVCTPTVLGEQTAFCDFTAPVGSTVRITSDDPLVAEPGDCTRNGDSHQFDCEIDVTGPRSIFLSMVIPQ